MGARTLRTFATLAAALAAASLSTPLAQAAVIDATSVPAKVSVGATGPATVSVSWRVVRENVDPPQPGTLSSPSLRFLVGGTVVATLPRSLTRSVQGLTTNETVSIKEVLQISEAAVYRAIKQGQALRVTREFVDSVDDISGSAELLVTPSGPGSAELSVQRLELSFDDDTRTRVLPKGNELRVIAELSTAGVGLLAVQWEVATGSSSAGTPVFRPLALVRQGVAGGGRTVITSPPLPTSEEGTNFVRLRVLDPAFTYDTPTLQYYVTPKNALAATAAQRDILLSGPRPGETLTAETRFAWSAIDGADAYQIAFYATPTGPSAPLDPSRGAQMAAPQTAPDAAAKGEAALAGVFIPASRTETALEAFTLAHLPSGRSYLWKVMAVDANGTVIGSSSTREIYKP